MKNAQANTPISKAKRAGLHWNIPPYREAPPHDPLAALHQVSPLQDKLRLRLDTVQRKYREVERMAVALYDHDTDWVRTFLAVEAGSNPLAHYQARLVDTTWLKEIADTQSPRVINNFDVLHNSRKRHVQALIDAGYLSSYTVPMCVNGHFFGFIFFNSKSPGIFDPSLISELDMVGHMAALLAFNERANVRTLVATVKSALDMTHSRDPETGNHLERMSRYARLIAHSLAPRYGKDEDFVEHVYLFAPLHDLGKITVPDSVLLKPGILTPEELVIMREHASAGLKLINQLLDNFGLSGVGHVDMLRNIVICHHEAIDGSGYPHGIRGAEIPLEARMVTTADVFDALTSERPYKPAWSNERAALTLREMAGKKLDPECVEALLARPDEIEQIQQGFRENTFG